MPFVIHINLIYFVEFIKLAPGAYFVEVKAGKEVMREKLLKTE